MARATYITTQPALFAKSVTRSLNSKYRVETNHSPARPSFSTEEDMEQSWELHRIVDGRELLGRLKDSQNLMSQFKQYFPRNLVYLKVHIVGSLGR